MDETNTNPLTIRLTESAVFLRSGGVGRQSCDDSRPSMLRGLLTLELAKPTRISSIELELVASAVTSWPEGVGAGRVELTEEHKIFHASTIYFRAGEVQASRRHASIGPGAAYHDTALGDQHISSHRRNREDAITLNHDGLSSPTPNRHAERTLSVDNHFFQRIPLSHEEFPVAATPPYSPSVTQSSSPTLSSTAEIMEDFPSRLQGEYSDHSNADLRTQRGESTGSPLPMSPNSTPVHPELFLSRRPSVVDVPENYPGPSSLRQSSVPPLPISRPPSPPGLIPSPGDSRGRRSSRFSLSSVLGDAIQLNAARAHRFATSRESPHEDERNQLSRGRTKEKGKGVARVTTPVARRQGSKDQSALRKIGTLFKLDHNDNQACDEWKEFKKGTYTYPISYAIPASTSPTIRCPYGSVIWRLKATVHRPGTFTSKLGATREVLVINSPTEDENEDMEHIVVERHWDQQLQYLISVSGRSFFIGGSLPITLTLMPLAKIKIHQIHVFIEERIDYYTQVNRTVRTDPLTRIELLSLRNTGTPILPLESDKEDVFKKSPLCALAQPEDDLSEVASNYMGPGPWTITSNLKLPTSCRSMHTTNKSGRSNIIITHLLKCVIRLERGDDLDVDPKSGKRRLFDITAQTPIQIFSCRCNPKWISLPPYLESFDNGSRIMPKCPCDVTGHGESNEGPSTTSGVHARLSTLTNGQPHGPSGVARSTVHLTTSGDNNLLFNRSNQYERLISGQESELGEAPPLYTPVELHPVVNHEYE